MDALAVVLEAPQQLSLRQVQLTEPGEDDVVVRVAWSGISTGTERLLYMGQMPAFPGMGYPLVPGYESVGYIVAQGRHAGRTLGERVFVPGSRGFANVRGLFGGAAARVVLPAARAMAVPALVPPKEAILLALAATAHHAVVKSQAPQLIVGHGVLGRLAARITVALGHAPPTVWEQLPSRQSGALGYTVIAPDSDPRRDYAVVMDASGDVDIIGALIGRLAAGGEVVLAGFYTEPIRFDFVPAFMREASLRVSAEWKPADLTATVALIEAGRLSLEDLITHTAPVSEAQSAYQRAFSDPACLKMVLDWGHGDAFA